MEEEIWLDIPEYVGLYQASTHGRIKSLNYKKSNKEQILILYIGTHGYLQVVLCNKGKEKNWKVHKLIAMTFLNHIPDGTHNIEVDHIDENKLNNYSNNLRLVKSRFNSSRSKKGISKYTGVTWCKRSGKWLASIRINGKKKHLGYFNNEDDAGKAYEDVLQTIL
jgi:hypothetical protein